MVAVKNVNSTVYKVNTVHDPMLFEYDWNPNLQKQFCYNINGQYVITEYAGIEMCCVCY
jgi:hypothetical protein